jgi:type III secretory pathway component EscV
MKMKKTFLFRKTCKKNSFPCFDFFHTNHLMRYSTKSFIQNKEIRDRLEHIENKYDDLNKQLTKVNKSPTNHKNLFLIHQKKMKNSQKI